ncbi:MULTISPECIES: DUF6879 family protein [unclassified Streptomyces]|uniref:DUF6879 family protein n=1 Tax=unclassified Streptomyces TaxID=2593676 RepID=UPI002025656E|nr:MULTISPECIES: DUF6879 family protein [unclassified Streptomyces]MCX4550636.1 hypothetical protein [Streptomyces sp. NBC_01500]WSC22080.1 hypothetical protein OIE60_21630 [Streptomyces sp. NBC_01766]
MPELVSGEEFLQLFKDCSHTAFRLEVRSSYGIPDEDEPYRRFLAGKAPGLGWFAPWLDLMRTETGTGKRVARVRVIDDPPSDYLRFELWGTPHNLAAGEDIRYLGRDQAKELELPDYDFWVFDSRTVARLQFGEHDRFLGVVLSEEPTDVLHHVQWREAAWHHAITFADYEQENTPSR